MKEGRNPASIHAPFGAYSHQIEVRGAERVLVLSGQVGVEADGRIPDDPAEQLGVAMDNVLANLAAAGMGARDLVKLTFYLVGASDAAERRAVLAQRLGDHEPCMTLVYVSALSAPALKAEVDAWASAPQSDSG